MVKIILILSAALYSAAIAYFSLINLADTPVPEMGVSDKILHGGAYFFLVLLWCAALIPKKGKINFLRKILIICCFCILFGILIEVLQNELTTYRSFDYLDMAANSFGAITASILQLFLRKSLTRLKS